MRYTVYMAILLLMLSSSGVAQVPGFMGKRFSVFVDANPTPAFMVMNTNNEAIVASDFSKVNRFAFNFRPQVNLEYLVHRDISIGFSYSRIMFGTTKVYVTEPDGGDEFTSPTHYHDWDVVRGIGAGVHFKFFHFRESNSIAPIGFYQMASFYVTKCNTYDTKKSKVKQFKDDFLYPVATYSWGRQSMIAKNVLLKSGVEFGWAFVPFNFFSESADEWTVSEHSGYNYHGGLFGYYFFNVNVAIGYTF